MSRYGPMLAKSRKRNLHNPGGMKCGCCNPMAVTHKGRRQEKHRLRRYEKRQWQQDFRQE